MYNIQSYDGLLIAYLCILVEEENSAQVTPGKIKAKPQASGKLHYNMLVCFTTLYWFVLFSASMVLL